MISTPSLVSIVSSGPSKSGVFVGWVLCTGCVVIVFCVNCSKVVLGAQDDKVGNGRGGVTAFWWSDGILRNLETSPGQKYTEKTELVSPLERLF